MAKGARKTRRFIAPCEWCARSRECDAEKRTAVVVKYVCTMFDLYPYQCPDHEPLWYRGMEGVRA